MNPLLSKIQRVRNLIVKCTNKKRLDKLSWIRARLLSQLIDLVIDIQEITGLQSYWIKEK